MITIKQFAEQCHKNNIATVPTEEGKNPVFGFKWKGMNKDLTPYETSYGIGIQCGEVSDGLECLDIDNHLGNAFEIYEEFILFPDVDRMLRESKISVETTQSDGVHMVWKSDFCGRNQKLAQQEGISIKGSDIGQKKIKTVIETRGDNGYFVCAPTKGYKWLEFSGFNNSVFDLVKITKEERETLISYAKSFNTVHKNQTVTQTKSNERVGDIYDNDPQSIEETKIILEKNGWVLNHPKKGFYTRPGKSSGISASFGFVAPNVFYVFTSNGQPFEEGRAYTPFQVKALLEYNSDFKQCAKDLAVRYDLEITSKVDEVKKPSDFISELDKFKVDYLSDIAKPPSVLSVIQGGREIDIMSQGDFSLLMGMQKSKKTFLMSLIASAMMIDRPLNNILLSNLPPNKKKIAIFDTEQGEWYSHTTARRIYFQSGKKRNFDFFHLRKLGAYDRRSLIEAYLKKNKDVGFIVIDGIVDLLHDFNNQEESANAVQWLMTLTANTGVHALNILHVNPSKDKYAKARGHLGTIMAQKAETVIKIEKEDDSISIITAEDTRGKSFKPFNIEIDINGNARLIEGYNERELII